VLLAAHEALEGLVLTAEEREFKQQVDQQWSQKGYQGLVDAPLTGALEAFIDDTQRARHRLRHGEARRWALPRRLP